MDLWFIEPDNLSPTDWPEASSILYGSGVLFIGYEGFGLVTNAAGDMRNPRRMLPRALYTSVIIVIAIYLAVSLTVSGNLTTGEIEAPATMRWPRPPGRFWASSVSG